MGSELDRILLKEKFFNSEQLKSIEVYKKQNDAAVVSAIISLGFVSEEEIAQTLSRQLGYPYINLDQFESYPDVVNLIPVEIARKYLVMPMHCIRSFLTIAMADPTELNFIEDIRFMTGLSIQPVIASESGIINAIEKYYGFSDSLKVKKIMDEIEQAEDTSVNIIE